MDQGGMNPSQGGTGAQSTGLTPNIAALLSYLLFTPIGGIIFYLVEKTDRFVRFHAMQSIIFGAALIVIWIATVILGIILGILFAPLGCLVGLVPLVIGIGGFVLWILLMLKAYQGAMWKLPIIGDMAERYV